MGKMEVYAATLLGLLLQTAFVMGSQSVSMIAGVPPRSVDCHERLTSSELTQTFTVESDTRLEAVDVFIYSNISADTTFSVTIRDDESLIELGSTQRVVVDQYSRDRSFTFRFINGQQFQPLQLVAGKRYRMTIEEKTGLVGTFLVCDGSAYEGGELLSTSQQYDLAFQMYKPEDGQLTSQSALQGAGSSGQGCQTLPERGTFSQSDSYGGCWTVTCPNSLLFVSKMKLIHDSELDVKASDTLDGPFHIAEWYGWNATVYPASRIFQGSRVRFTLWGSVTFEYRCLSSSWDSPCDESYGSGGTVNYPDGPQDYSNWENRCWTFGYCRYGLHINWTRFHVQKFDAVMVATTKSLTTGNFKTVATLSGHELPPPVTTDGYTLIHFTSDETSVSTGFAIEFKCVAEPAHPKPVPVSSFTDPSSLWGSCRLVDVPPQFDAQYDVFTSVGKHFDLGDVPLECTHDTCNVVVLLYECDPCNSKKGKLREQLMTKGFTRTRCGPWFQCTETQNTRHPLITYVNTLSRGDTITIELDQDSVEYVIIGISKENQGVNCAQHQDVDTCHSSGGNFCMWNQQGCVPHNCVSRGPSPGSNQCKVCA